MPEPSTTKPGLHDGLLTRAVPRRASSDSTSRHHAFTVDVEEWFQGIELNPSDWPSDSRLHTGLDPLMELLESCGGVKATFFVLGAVAERFPEVVAEIARAGHEVGCHGHQHEFVYRQSPEEFRSDLQRARDALGNATGDAPIGYRAPYFSINSDSLWALDILSEEGFVYDNSIFPVKNDRYGIPDAPRTPFDVPTTSGTLVEIPLTPLRIGGVNLPFSGARIFASSRGRSRELRGTSPYAGVIP